jgi:hypothetical protein
MTETGTRITVDRPFVIRDPSISFVNLYSGPAINPTMRKDFADLSPMFAQTVPVVDGRIPVCDILFAYCQLGPATEIVGSRGSLRDLLIAARARIIVVASEIPASTLSAPSFGRALTARTKEWQANIVLVGSRNEPHFGPFFRSLFEQMWNGVSMMVAWNQLAPQIPNMAHTNVPGTLFLAEVSHIVFAKAGAAPAA